MDHLENHLISRTDDVNHTYIGLLGSDNIDSWFWVVKESEIQISNILTQISMIKPNQIISKWFSSLKCHSSDSYSLVDMCFAFNLHLYPVFLYPD
jgi:hypothetical protein